MSKEVRSASDVTPYIAAIHQYVGTQVDKLKSGDAHSARESLIDEVSGGLVPPSASFCDDYCGELASSLNGLATNPDPRVRLNAAIITARVAERAQDASARLAPLIVTQLKDDNKGVVLWALRAAKFVIPPVVNFRPQNQIVPAVVAAAKRLNDGAVTGAAYDALYNTNATTLKLFIPTVQDLLGWRIKQYANGLPPEPPMDAKGAYFLGDRSVFLAQDKATQTKSVQLLVDLIAANVNAFQTAQVSDRDLVALAISNGAKAMAAIGINTGDPTLTTAMTALSSVSGRTSPAQVSQAFATAMPAVTTSFSQVHAAAPTTQAATAPKS